MLTPAKAGGREYGLVKLGYRNTVGQIYCADYHTSVSQLSVVFLIDHLFLNTELDLFTVASDSVGVWL